jgi:hypothetical protein
VARREHQPHWQDPASGYRLPDASPSDVPIRIVQADFPPGGRVAFENGGGDRRVHQQVWVFEDAMDITRARSDTDTLDQNPGNEKLNLKPKVLFK